MTDPALTVIGAMDAARILGIDRATVTRWIAAERITPIGRIGGKDNPVAAYVFDEAAIAALRAKIEKQREQEPLRAQLRAQAHAAYLRAVDAITAGEIDPDEVTGFDFVPIPRPRSEDRMTP